MNGTGLAVGAVLALAAAGMARGAMGSRGFTPDYTRTGMTWRAAAARFKKARNKYAGAWLSGRSTRLMERSHHGEDPDYAIRYHATDVVTIHPDGTYTLRAGGWSSVTTAERIMAYSPARVRHSRKDDTLTISHGPKSEGFWEPFFDGAQVDARGTLLNPREPVRRLGLGRGNAARVVGVPNEDVAPAWKEGRPAANKGATFRTDGLTLWSYDLVIGQTLPDLGKVAWMWIPRMVRGEQFPGVSLTTSGHVERAMRVADTKLYPEEGGPRLGRRLPRPPNAPPPRDEGRSPYGPRRGRW